MSERLTDDERETLFRRLRDAEREIRGAAVEVSAVLGLLQADYYAGRRAKWPLRKRLSVRWRSWRNRRYEERYMRDVPISPGIAVALDDTP